MEFRITLGLLLAVLLAGCDSTTQDGGSVVIDSNSTGSISTPSVLRKIPISDLSVAVGVSGSETTYLGANFPEGNWNISIVVSPQQTHSLSLKWFAGEILVLEESGSFYAESANTPIRPDLDFLSGGSARFDVDCDGINNLDEIRLGTNPRVASGTSDTHCQLGTVDEPFVEVPWVLLQHRPFESKLSSRLIRYEQNIQVSAVQFDLKSAASVRLLEENTVETAGRVTAVFEFLHSPSIGRRLRFRINSAIGFQAAEVEGVVCGTSGVGDMGFACTIPYEWQEQQWYTVLIEETTAGIWQASVREVNAGPSQVIGSIETEAGYNWLRAQNGFTYVTEFTSVDCQSGLPASSMRYSGGLANNEHEIDSLQILVSRCVRAGAGWSEGLRTINDQLIYGLTLGTRM